MNRNLRCSPMPLRGITVRPMRDRRIMTLALGMFLLAGLGAWSDSHAVPAFARQTNFACAACHYQSYPALNAFGRAFKAGGYTMIGSQQGQVVGDDLGLPVVLNSSLVTKFRYQKTNGDDKTVATNTGELQFPDEGAFLVGGRAGEHVGFLLELATFGEADVGSGEVTGTADAVTGDVAGAADTGSGEFNLFASFKMPFTYEIRGTNVAFIPFLTDALGVAYSFELLNTGAQRSQRVGEDRSAMMAQQYLGLGSGAAEGFAFVAAHATGFVNVSMWAPVHGSAAIKSFAPYARVALTPRIGDWDAGIGAQYLSGKAVEVDDTGAEIDHRTKGWAVDGQMQGMIGALPLGVYAAYGEVPATPLRDNVFNATEYDRTAWSIHGQVGVVPNRATLLLGYRAADTGAPSANEDNAVTVGGTYQVMQNVQVQLNHAMFSGSRYDTLPAAGDRRTTLMLFSAF